MFPGWQERSECPTRRRRGFLYESLKFRRDERPVAQQRLSAASETSFSRTGASATDVKLLIRVQQRRRIMKNDSVMMIWSNLRNKLWGNCYIMFSVAGIRKFVCEIRVSSLRMKLNKSCDVGVIISPGFDADDPAEELSISLNPFSSNSEKPSSLLLH